MLLEKLAKLIHILVIMIMAGSLSIRCARAESEQSTLGNYKISNGFYLESRKLQFNSSIRNKLCTGNILYPVLTRNGEDLYEINDEIKDFAEIYSICNENEENEYSVKYIIPESNHPDYFSVVWTTYKLNKPYRIDALNFEKRQDNIVNIEKIFNPLASLMRGNIFELSKGHLSGDLSWQEFFVKIKKREVQLYIANKEWFIIFNPNSKSEHLNVSKLPEYYLVGDDVANTR